MRRSNPRQYNSFSVHTIILNIWVFASQSDQMTRLKICAFQAVLSSRMYHWREEVFLPCRKNLCRSGSLAVAAGSGWRRSDLFLVSCNKGLASPSPWIQTSLRLEARPLSLFLCLTASLSLKLPAKVSKAPTLISEESKESCT